MLNSEHTYLLHNLH